MYDWLLKNAYADGNLIAKWKKQGYEKVGSFIVLRACKSTDFLLALLFEMYTDERDQLQCDMHLSSTQGTIEGGAVNSVCKLRLSRLFISRLKSLHLEGNICWAFEAKGLN